MSDLGTVYKAYRIALIATDIGAPSWGTKAYNDHPPASTPQAPVSRPYVVSSYSAGGDENDILRSDPNLLIDVICVADSSAAALAGAEEIRKRLDNHGELDRIPTVVGDANYAIKTITHEQRIHFVEEVNSTTRIYHSGGRYRNQLEKR